MIVVDLHTHEFTKLRFEIQKRPKVRDGVAITVLVPDEETDEPDFYVLTVLTELDTARVEIPGHQPCELTVHDAEDRADV